MNKTILNNILNKIKKVIISEEKRLLGRWNIDYCNNKMNRKIDLSNEDHCGPCGEFILGKIKKESSNILPNLKDIKDIKDIKKV